MKKKIFTWNYTVNYSHSIVRTKMTKLYMKHSFKLFFLFSICVLACKFPNKNQAKKLNGAVCDVYDSLVYKNNLWNGTYEEARVSKNFTKLVLIRIQLAYFIDENIETINQLKDIGGSEGLRKSELDLLDFEKQKIMDYYLPVENFDASTSDDKLIKWTNKLTDIANTERTKQEEFLKLQKEYTEKNGLKPRD